MEPQQLQLRILDTVRLSPPPAPAQHAAALPLSGLDADRNALDVTFRTLRIFPPPPPSINPHAVLPLAFEAALGLFPALRARIAGEAGVKLTTFEVVAAFIWRARVKANGTSSGEVVKMVYSMNISRLVDPPLPDGYWGNVCVPVYVALAAGDLVAQPLAATAALIRRSKQTVDDEYVRSYVDFQELHRHDGVTAGAVSAFTDWRRLGHGEVDFGWGGPDSVLPLSWRILGSTEPCFLLPYGAGDERRRGGFKVFIALQRTALAGFREEMQELLLQPQQNSAGKL